MANNNTTEQRRLVEFKDGCRHGKFGRTKAYELIAEERIRAYKMGGKTLIDLNSIDEYHASLPRVISRAIRQTDLHSSMGASSRRRY
jgi:excisionase family DNA binding protein